MLWYRLSILPLLVFPSYPICHLLFKFSLSPFLIYPPLFPFFVYASHPREKNHPIFDFRFGSIFLPMFLSPFSYSLCFLACASPFSQRMLVAGGRQCSHLIRPFTPTTFVRPNAYPSRLACRTFLPGLG